MPTLLAALGDERPRALLLTHIHLDHAAATGALVRRWPELEVYVHERGAPHLIDPSKLLASAERLYGDQMRAALGRDRAGPRGQREGPGRRRGRARHARRLHARPRLPPRLLPARGERHRLRRRRRRRPHPGHGPDRAADAAARHRRRALARLDRHRRGLAPRAPRAHPLRPGRRPDRAPRPSAGACAKRPSSPASSRRGTTSATIAPWSPSSVEARRPPRSCSRPSRPQYQWRGLDRYWSKRAERIG